MEAISTAAALTELLSLSIKVSRAAKSLVESFVHAPNELVQLTTKIIHIQSRIEQLQLLGQEVGAIGSAALLPSEHQAVLSAGLQTNLEALQAVQSLCDARLGNAETNRTRWRWAILDKKKANRILEKIAKAESHLSVMLAILGVRLTSLNQISLEALTASHALLHSGLRESTESVKELIQAEIRGLIKECSVGAVSDEDSYQSTYTESTHFVDINAAQQENRYELRKQSAPILQDSLRTDMKERVDPSMRVIEHDMRRSLSTYTVIYGSLREPRTDDRHAVGAMLMVQSKRNRRRLRLVFEIGFKLFSQHVFQFELNLQQIARHWAAIPTVGCSIPIFNVRPNDAPIFQACRDRDINRVRYLLESGQASVHDVDDKIGGLLEHVVQGHNKLTFYLDQDYYRIQQLVEHLLDQGCEANAFYGPIHDLRLPAILNAFLQGYSSAVSVLLLHGADIVSFDSIVPRCLQNINGSFQWKMDILRSMGYSDWKPDLSHRPVFTSTILDGACETSNVEELLYALEVVGLEPSIQMKCENRKASILELAICKNFLKGVAILVECGVTAHLSSYWVTIGIAAVSHYLLLQGADPQPATRFLASAWQLIWLKVFREVEIKGAMSSWSFTSLEGSLAHLLAHGSDPFELPHDSYSAPITSVHEIARLSSYSTSKCDIRSDPETIEQTEGARLNFGWTRTGQICEVSSAQQRERQLGGRTEEARPSLVQNPQVSRDELENGPDLGLGAFFRNQTQLYHHTSSAEGRKRLARFPIVLALCDALQFTGYRAEMDDDGDIWYEIDDGDRYFDAREYQDQDGRGDWSGEFCPICQDFERYGLGHVLEEAEEAKRELWEYREKVRAAKYRL